ncbi:TetR/AcrR family transcriptional regulator [Acinetobacter sp. ANC 4779]|uniref:TetR/AcrR family transcriptional regulator n=1 Tax=Acinetobacter sp. ANC 4779 TaxID=2529848 RepID=UPI00103F238D|nr:TetR/AcrR family transcriptional regulator [Acinetobacter sp. ANC 4779]TCB51888.1 TetR/AcrR family transcriptional regulator [Acinetobacter sp. ANC 4779]
MKISDIQVRRKPRQSRAKLTQEALQESFVRLLHERAAHDITIREITDLAGVGLGTFYEYFSNKEDLIALTIHRQVKNNAADLKIYAQSLIELSTYHDISDYLSQIIQFQIQQIQQQHVLWAHIFLLERQVSSQESYQKHYQLMTELWDELLQPFMQPEKSRQRSALNLHRIIYGFISQTLLVNTHFKEWEDLTQDILAATQSFICNLNATVFSHAISKKSDI